ncbi:DUF3052 family protein [Aquimarina sp. MMG016]|uniref:DUF3052 family protein n=1 Tax=Aquimarina sp. MMG016 TaxID=2822690 RepID=UPI001B39F050|nr:DUF3052 family protein [Aquimarina sp. MMG016]MBQ4819252.1 DUF3052 family protein [Aquimarina sp. MMG016]
MPAGYSGTPLAKKLGIKEGYTVLYYNKPDHYFDLFSDFPDKTIEVKEFKTESTDFIHLFCTTMDELQETVTKYKSALHKNGLLWVSWPKGSSKIPTDLKREPIREYLLDIGLVDVKVCAVDADWSGLKFVYRVKDR